MRKRVAGAAERTEPNAPPSPPGPVVPGKLVGKEAAEQAAREEAERARAAHLELCRNDVNAFIEYVMVDEETGKYLEQARIHVLMQRAMDEQTPGYQAAANDDEELKPEEKGGARLVVMAHPESGKTNQLAVGRVLWL